jgi:enolase
MSTILGIMAREILDSRGQPTVEVDVITSSGKVGRAAVPSGASTGAHEACELRDGDKTRYHGKGVLKAISNIEEIIEPELEGLSVLDQRGIDQALIEIDGTANKTKLGANAILGVSLAVAKAAAEELELELFQYIGGPAACRLPVPLMNVMNGGAHANNGIDIQEFMIVPHVKNNFRDSLRAGSEIFQVLKKILADKNFSVAVGDEGGFAPRLANHNEALDLIMMAIEKAGYKPGVDVHLALDVAATEMFSGGLYQFEGKKIKPEELLGIYEGWAKKYPLWSIEDGFAEDDWSSWKTMTQKMPSMQIVGDDLFVTNTERLKRGINEGIANALLVKVNQIGTLTETMEAVRMAQKNKYRTVMSHRSGETEDVTIADLCVALDCHQIKTGSLCRGERTAKYNQLLRIEEELGPSAKFYGAELF